MSNEIINYFANNKEFKNEIKEEYIAIKNLSPANKIALTPDLFAKFKQYEAALKLAGQTIIDLDIENEALMNQLEKYGKYDPEEIKRTIKFIELQESNKDDHDRLKRRLFQTLNKTKCIN